MVTAVQTMPPGAAEATPEEFVAELRTQLMTPGRGMVNHPYVVALEAGTATMPQIQYVTKQFYLHIRNMLPWIGEIYVKCPYEDVREVLVKNLAEECMGTFSGTKAHPELLLDFARAIGADVDEWRVSEQLPVGRRLTEYFEFMSTCRDWFVPLSAIGIGLESFVPQTFKRMVAAFKTNYNMPDDDIVFWAMHIEADEEHGDEGIELVSKYAITPEQREVVFQCTIETAERFYELWNLFSAVPAGAA
jgi:pyrroloquinoline-quinone synthase